MWVRLSAQYLRNAVETRYVLQTRFYEYRFKPENDVMAHITEIETMATQLTDIGATIDAISIMTKIICTLPPSYRSFVTAWDSVPFADRTMALLTSRLLKEEEMAKRWNTGTPDSQDAAFFAHQNPSYSPAFKSNSRGRDHFRRGGRSSSSRQQPYRFCKYRRCNIAGHTIEVCRKRIRDEEEAEREKNTSIARVASTQEEEDTEDPEQHLNDDAYFSFSCFIGRSNLDWFADSGATQHMSDQRSFFCTFKPVLSDSWTVNGIGSTRLFVCGYGNVEFIVSVGTVKRAVTIKNVLYVPNLGTNLISIAAVTAVGLSVHFIETKVTFEKNKAVVMMGERIGKTLYHLSILPKISELQRQTDTAFFSAPLPTPIDVWHQSFSYFSLMIAADGEQFIS